MSEERRYSDEEVLRIFDEAARVRDEGLDIARGRPSGMTLAELKRIGGEVGIDSARIEGAARALDVRHDPGRRRLLGLPIGVGRTVSLPRRLTEQEWERLVVDLRGTFEARGAIDGSGSFRQWTNGNLQVLLEPDGDTHRLRLRTTRGLSRAFLVGGGTMTAVALLITLVAFVTGSGDLGAATQLAAIGLGLAALGAVPLPRWAAERERQMEDVAARAMLMASEEPEGDPGPD